MSTFLGRIPNTLALPLGFVLLPVGVVLLPLAPEIGVPLSLLATRFLGRKFSGHGGSILGLIKNG